jgi:hypothetical protein
LSSPVVTAETLPTIPAKAIIKNIFFILIWVKLLYKYKKLKGGFCMIFSLFVKKAKTHDASHLNM